MFKKLLLALPFVSLHAFGFNYESTPDLGDRSIFFKDNAELKKMDFKTLNSILINVPQVTLDRLRGLGAILIYQISSNEIIFDANCHGEAGTRKSVNCIYWGNLQNGDYKFLTEGQISAYFHDTQQLFYLKNYGGLNNYITVATLKDKKLEGAYPISKSSVAGQSVVRIDPGHFLINDFMHQGDVELYDFKTHALTKLNIPFCYAQLWVSADQQLLCRDKNYSFFLTPLDGKGEVKKLKLKGSSVGVFGYDPKSNQALIGKSVYSLRGGLETPSIWVYDLNKDSGYMLKYAN